ncbi:MAG: hypothetical protein V1815_00310 [Candidatus Woesearchaeota archaeon]
MKTDKFFQLIRGTEKKYNTHIKVIQYNDCSGGYAVFFPFDLYIDVKDKSKMGLFSKVYHFLRLHNLLTFSPKKGLVLRIDESRHGVFIVDRINVEFKKDYFDGRELEKRIKDIYSNDNKKIPIEFHEF